MPLPKSYDFKSLSAVALEPSYIANRYLRQKILGSGTFGKVFLVNDVRQPMSVMRAAKEIYLPCGEDDQCALDAVKEAQMLSNLYHPHIVQMCDAILENNNFYIVMELCEHGTLEECVQKSSKTKNYFNFEQIVCWLTQLADALSYIHSKRIIHRDLKSRNIFLHQNGKSDWPDLKIGDFGISRTLYTSTEKATTLVGTPFYLSPELLQQMPYDRKSDSWALGCLLYEMCALTYPFNTSGTLADLMNFIVYSEPDFNKFPKSLRKFQLVCNRLLNKVPSCRLSAEEVLLETLVSMHVVSHSSHHEYCRSMISLQNQHSSDKCSSENNQPESLTKFDKEVDEYSFQDDSSTMTNALIAEQLKKT